MEKQVISARFCYDTEKETRHCFHSEIFEQNVSLPRRQTVSTWALISSNLPRLNFEDIFLAWPIPQNMSRIKRIQST